jgi:predicted DNA-binding antitoxin AbrB/MazE fold protein
MFQSIEGIYRDGKIELLEVPDIQSGVRVIVTFLSAEEINLETRGISKEQAENLRGRLQSFAEDWDHPSMAIYDAP